MLDGGHDLTQHNTIGSQLVNDDALGRQALFPQQTNQQSLGCLGITGNLNDFIQDIFVLIHGAPQPALSPSDANDSLIKMPHTALQHHFLDCMQADIRAFPYLNESDGFANQLVSDSNYLPLEVGRHVKGPFC
ncbi:hypothetical protein IL59_0210845 [Brucella suis bv. 4 str. 40]|nr:hypothetical protein IL59_0210845 [Brucella suis bv. 4 str. 40]